MTLQNNLCSLLVLAAAARECANLVLAPRVESRNDFVNYYCIFKNNLSISVEIRDDKKMPRLL